MSAQTWETSPGVLVSEPPPRTESDLVRIYVWEWPVRVAHWAIASSLVVLAATGIYMGRPLFSVAGQARDHFVTGTVKVVHFYAAIVFTLAVLSRIFWMFRGNRFARWDKFIPVKRRRREGLVAALRFYLFNLRKPPGFMGHNPLAGLTYTLVFFLYLTMIGTGLALYSASASVTSPLHLFKFLGPFYGGLQSARFIHHVVMWLLLGFAVHHIYSAILMSQVEGNGTMESIFSGYKFVHRDDVLYSGYRFFPRKHVEPEELLDRKP